MLVINAISQVPSNNYEVSGIGISYQMHGLVMVDKNKDVLYPSIIWCDSRAVDIGDKAFIELGSEYCLGNCLKLARKLYSFKLKWVKDNRPDIFERYL